MAMVGLAEAAKLARRSQSTIHRAMKRGQLSFTVGEHGERRIDTAELCRAFDLKPPNGIADMADGNASAKADMPDAMSRAIAGHAVQAVELAALQRQLEMVREERERERQEAQTTIADLRRRLDAESEERRRLTAVLADQRSDGPVPPTGGSRRVRGGGGSWRGGSLPGPKMAWLIGALLITSLLWPR